MTSPIEHARLETLAGRKMAKHDVLAHLRRLNIDKGTAGMEDTYQGGYHAMLREIVLTIEKIP